MTVYANFDTGFVRDGEEVVGLNLGYSCSFPHEHGISEVMMDRLCGFSIGLEEGFDPKMLKLFVYNNGQEALLVLDNLYELTCEMKGLPVDYTQYFENHLKRYGNYVMPVRPGESALRDENIDSIWDANQLAVRIRGEENVRAMQALYEGLIKEGFVIQSPRFCETAQRPRFGLMTRMPGLRPQAEQM